MNTPENAGEGSWAAKRSYRCNGGAMTHATISDLR
jgi:hypothetical protein